MNEDKLTRRERLRLEALVCAQQMPYYGDDEPLSPQKHRELIFGVALEIEKFLLDADAGAVPSHSGLDVEKAIKSLGWARHGWS